MKKKINELTVKNLSELARDDQKAFQELVVKSMPEFVALLNQKEDMANAMYSAGQEFLLVVDDVLIRYFGFTEEKILEFHTKLKPILQGVEEFEKHGLDITSPHSIATVADVVDEKGISGVISEIANIRMTKERMNRSDLEYPISSGAKPFLRKLKEKNK